MLIEDQTKVSNKQKFIKNFPYLENFIKQKLKESLIEKKYSLNEV